jgi:hypothetical protein
MGGGASSGLMQAFGNAVGGLTAAGTTQADALQLSSAVNRFTTVASGAGCKLPLGQPGDEVLVYNGGANALVVYPPVGGAVNALSANGGVSLSPGTEGRFVKHIGTTAWSYSSGTQDSTVSVKEFGAVGNGNADDTSAVQAAIDFVFAQTNGGTVYIPAGEYRLTASLVLPKSIVKTIRLVGDGPRATTFYSGSSIASGTPVVRWDTSASGSCQLQSIEGMQIARLNGGPLVQFRQNAGSTGASGDRLSVVLKGLVLRQSTSAGQDPNLDIEYSLKSYYERIWIEGGHPSGIGIKASNCSQDYYCEIYGNGKSTIGDFFLISGGGDATLIATRSEGCAGNYFYKLLDCDHVTLVSPWMEGDLAQDSILFDGARYCTVLNASLGDQTGATNPCGIRFASTNRAAVGNIVSGGKSATFDALGTGATVVFNASAACNVVHNIVVEGVSSVSGEAQIAGTDNFCTLIPGGGSPPTVKGFSSAPFMAAGVVSRGVSPQFGSADNFSVQIIQNGNVVATFTGTSGKLLTATLQAAAAAGAAGEVVLGNTTQSTVGAAGGASALPATPTGYLKFFLGSTQYVLPYYAQA